MTTENNLIGKIEHFGGRNSKTKYPHYHTYPIIPNLCSSLAKKRKFSSYLKKNLYFWRSKLCGDCPHIRRKTKIKQIKKLKDYDNVNCFITSSR